MASETLLIGNMGPEEVYKTVVDKGLSPTDAAILVGEWIIVTGGQGKRVFEYKQAFPETATTCVAAFARTFAHQDWIDGESVVQASQTTGELGFNERFHRIEADFDALAKDVALSFTCLANMRKDLRKLLDEIRIELNKINGDIHECCHKSSGVATIQPGLVGTAKYLGKIKYETKMMQLWETNAGMMLLPDIETLEGPPWTNPRAKRASKFARFVEEDPRVKTTFPQAVTKKELVDRFGNERLADGTLVRDLVNVLPDRVRYASVDAMATDLLDREAAALKTTAGAPEAIATSLGLGQDVKEVGSVPIERFEALAPKARAALAKAGIDTIEKFAGAAPAEVATILEREGVAGVTKGDVAEAGTIAKTIMKLK